MIKALLIIFAATASGGLVFMTLAATSQQVTPLVWAAGCWIVAALAMMIASALDGETTWE